MVCREHHRLSPTIIEAGLRRTTHGLDDICCISQVNTPAVDPGTVFSSACCAASPCGSLRPSTREFKLDVDFRRHDNMPSVEIIYGTHLFQCFRFLMRQS